MSQLIDISSMRLWVRNLETNELQMANCLGEVACGCLYDYFLHGWVMEKEHLNTHADVVHGRHRDSKRIWISEGS